MSTPEDTQDGPDEQEDSPEELLGDLESIKEILNEEESGATPDSAAKEQADPEADVPMLEDMIGGAYQLDDSSSLLSATPVLGSGGRRRSRYLSEDLFDALLGEQWKSSASDILTGARGAIEAHRNQWTPEDTGELNEALRIRIDETLNEWLKATIAARLDELHAELLRAAESVIEEKIRALIAARAGQLDSEDD